MTVVIDDALLLAVLSGSPPPELEGETLYTTGTWYFRLGRVVQPGRAAGALSGRLAQLPLGRQRQVHAFLDALPLWIGVLSLRRLVPVVRILDPQGRLNLLAAEAVAAASVLDAGIAVVVEGPLLRAASDALGIPFRILDV